MNRSVRVTTTLLAAAALAGCATRAQLRRGLAEQQTALEAERSERMAADDQLRQQHTSDMAALRADLDSLRTQFDAKITMLEDGLQFDVPVHFGFDDAEVGPEATPVLDRFARVVQRYYPGSMISIEGFADPAGPAAYNQRLSLRRAQAVQTYLIGQGVPAEQLRTVGYGENRLVTPGAAASKPGAELNRRVAFVVETPPSATLGTPTATDVPTSTTMRETPASTPVPAEGTSQQ
jgi:peptidoglycan-associated lipoprotein